MKKLATFLVFGAVLAAGLPGRAMAADIVTLQCGIFVSNLSGVIGISASGGVTLPLSCAIANPPNSCSQCVAHLLNKGFKLANSFNVVQSTTDFAGPYFVFQR